MSDVLDSFWVGFADESEKIAAARWKTMVRSGKLSPKSIARIGKASGVSAARITPKRLSFSGEVSRGLRPASAPQPKPLPGRSFKQPGQVRPQPPKPSTPASAGPSRNTGVPQPNPPPPAPKAKGASPTEQRGGGFLRAAVESGAQMAPYMMMNRQQEPKRSTVYV